MTHHFAIQFRHDIIGSNNNDVLTIIVKRTVALSFVLSISIVIMRREIVTADQLFSLITNWLLMKDNAS